MSSVIALSLLCLSRPIHASAHAERPNIVFILADDLGWGNVGFHNQENLQIHTPRLDDLAATGLELSRMYVYAGCAPSRASFQSGRLPVYVSESNLNAMSSPTEGIPSGMTGIASKLKEASYSTYMIGKWDAGFSTFEQIPINKGYDYFYGHLGKAATYYGSASYDDCANIGDVDLWENDLPAVLPTESEYIEFAFRDKALEILEMHNPEEGPFMMVYSSQLPHHPSQIPEAYLEEDVYGNDESYCIFDMLSPYIYPGYDPEIYPCRTIMQSQVNLFDVIVGQIVDKLLEQNLWDNTLLIVQSDNGGSLKLTSAAGNNYPLRGGKSSDFEGGIRAVTIVNGGYLPDARRGQKEPGMIHIADWYVTWCSMVGIDPSDAVAVQSGLPDVSGYDMWPLISGEVQLSPRAELPISSNTLISGEMKLIRLTQQYALWTTAVWPDQDSSFIDVPSLACGMTGCLFNVTGDPEEHYDLADDLPDLRDQLLERFHKLSHGFWQNDQAGHDSCPTDFRLMVQIGSNPVKQREVSLPCSCWMAEQNWNGVVGPYQDVPDQYLFYNDSSGVTIHAHNTQKENGKQNPKNEYPHFPVPGRDIQPSAMRKIKEEIERMNDIELKWIERYEPESEESNESRDEVLDEESEHRLDALLNSTDSAYIVEPSHHWHKPGGFSDGGLGAPIVVYIGVAVMTSVCIFFICFLARLLKLRTQSSLLDDSDSYGTLEGYIY